MVPPQFTAFAASRDPNRSAGCTGPSPSSPTSVSAKPLRKEFHTPILAALHRPAALWQDLMVCTGFHHRVKYVFPIVYHRLRHKSTKTAQINHIFSAPHVHMSPQQRKGAVFNRPNTVSISQKPHLCQPHSRLIIYFLYFAPNTFVFLVENAILQKQKICVMI